MLLALLVALSKLPWQVWFAAAFFALLPLSYCKGRSDGKDVIRAAVAEASQKALKKASQAEIKADGSKTERDATFEQSQATIKEAVDEAIANDSDPISSYFDGLRASQSRGD
jgi:hypothetical protein